MQAETVFNVAVHLSKEELRILYFLIGQKLEEKKLNKRKTKTKLITKEEAIAYLLRTVFRHKS